MNRVPCKRRDIFFMPLEQADVSHHAQIKDTGCLVASARREQYSSVGLKRGFGYGVFMAVERCQASPIARVPELDLVVF